MSHTAVNNPFAFRLPNETGLVNLNPSLNCIIVFGENGMDQICSLQLFLLLNEANEMALSWGFACPFGRIRPLRCSPACLLAWELR